MLARFFNKLKRAWNIPTLRERIIFTLLMFLVARVGTQVPLPGIDTEKLGAMSQVGFMEFVNLVSGGAFLKASIFTLGIAPYINASIFIYIATLISPKLEEMQREGGKQKAKITQWTRYLAVILSLVYSVSTIMFIQHFNLAYEMNTMFIISTILILTASTTFLTWLGDQITTNGIGNGISLIIFLGIVARLPSSMISLFKTSNALLFDLTFIGILTLLMVLGIVAFQVAIRKIPVFYASGKGKTVATKSYLPIRINNAGVMPIIFAGLVINTVAGSVKLLPDSWDIKYYLQALFTPTSLFYMVFYFLAILILTFFYTAIAFDPEKIADNLKKSGASIPGVRPGKETVKYLEDIITKITFGGALFLALIATLPFALNGILGSAFGVGGTGIIIAVGVAIETLQQVEGALAMEDYQSFI